MLKLYSKLLSQSFQELLMYRLTGVTSVVFGLLFFSIELLTGWLLFSYTDSIIGWSRTDYFLLIITGTLITNGYQMFFFRRPRKFSFRYFRRQFRLYFCPTS